MQQPARQNADAGQVDDANSSPTSASTTPRRRQLEAASKNIVTSKPGYEGPLSQATVDVRNGHVVSKEPVEIEDAARHARCQAAGDRLESGDLVRFDRRRRNDLEARRTPKAQAGVGEMRMLLRPSAGSRIRAVRGGCAHHARSRKGAAERAAGLLAKPRRAGAYRSRERWRCATRTRSRPSRGDVRVQQGDTDHALQDAGRLLRREGDKVASASKPAVKPMKRQLPVRAASRRSSGWRPAAAWW